jgi:RND family efflux transporter MFP subunit
MANNEKIPPRDARKLGRKVMWRLGLLGLVAIGVAMFGITNREKAETDLRHLTRAQAIPTVAVVMPEHGVERQELVLPGDVEAWYQAPIYARVNGYVKMWYKDIGAKVKTGEVLAEIDTPDLDQQYEQAKGELAKAQANEALAELTAKRWEAMRVSNAVSQQNADEKAGKYNASKAEVAAAQADVAKLEALEGFKRIISPFDGVMTARNIDVGALVNSTPTSPLALFEVADVHEMRIYVAVPQSFSAELHVGMSAELKLPQYPDRSFKATLATTSNAISLKARSLLVELHRDNKDGLLQPGSFVEVHFELPANSEILHLPASALIFRKNQPEVATVGPGDRVKLKPIEVGRDLGTEVEVLSGLSTSDRVIRSPSDSIADGDQVRIAGQDKVAPEVSAR